MIHDGEIWINEVAPSRLKIITIQAQTGHEEKPPRPRAPAFKVHPKVFSMVENWESDSEYPVVTEINLDAVSQNDNQFQESEIKQEGEWITSPNKEGGHTSYKVLENVDNRYTVQYVDEVGGNSTSALIEFAILKRQLRKDGKLKSIRVLRVLGYRPFQ